MLRGWGWGGQTGDIAPLCSLIPAVESLCPPLFREPLQKCKQSPLLCLSFHQIPAFTLCPSCFISGRSWVSKLQILGTPTAPLRADPPGKDVSPLLLLAASPRKVVTGLRSGSKFMAKQNQKQALRLLPSAGVPAPMPGNSTAHWCHPFFCPWRGLAATPKCTPNRGTVYPCDPGDPQTILPTPRYPPFLPTEAPLSQA